MVQEFQLSITHIDGPRYLIRTERLPKRLLPAEEQVYWDVDRWLAASKQLMNPSLIQLLQGKPVGSLFTPPGGDREESLLPSTLMQLGQELYASLFQKSIQERWLAAQGAALSQEQGLRLRIGMKEPRLLSLPWEVLNMAAPSATRLPSSPLSTRLDVLFSRFHPFTETPWPEVQVPRGLVRILLVLASPEDQPMLALTKEAYHLQEQLRIHHDQEVDVQLDILDNPSREELAHCLEQGDYQVFHYAGHSNLGTAGGQLYLVNRHSGLKEILSGDDLAGLLSNNKVRFAVFNSCYSADGGQLASPDFQETSLAQALVRRGIPAVLAMAHQIPDQVAVSLTRLLYSQLRRRYPLDFCVNRMRQGLLASYGSDELYWTLPVLYLHPDFSGELLPPIDAELGQEADPDLMLTTAQRSLLAFDDLPLGGGEDLPLIPAWEEGSPSDWDLRNLIQETLQSLPEEQTSAPEPIVAPPLLESLPEGERAIPRRRSLRRRRFYQCLNSGWSWGLGTIGLGLGLALLGWWWSSQRHGGLMEPVLQSPPPLTAPTSLQSMKTADVTDAAVQSFGRGDLAEGVKAVTALLDRNAIPNARVALSSVDTNSLGDPQILFLQGRIAWQLALANNPDFDLADARRYWQAAVDKKPQVVLYLNALGFAYYAEGNYTEATDTWGSAFDALPSSDNVLSKDALITYSGLALGVRQKALTLKGEDRQLMFNRALKYRQLVLTSDPDGFNPTALANQWLWSPQAIEDWRAFVLPPQS